MKPLLVNRAGRIRLGFIVFLAFLGLWAYTPVQNYYDLKVRTDPSMFATVALSGDENGNPQITYSILVNQTIPVHFSAWLETAKGKRYCSGGSDWTYNREKHNGTKRPFELSAWLAVPSCSPPQEPYRACVDYTNLIEIGARYWGPFCSDLWEVSK